MRVFLSNGYTRPWSGGGVSKGDLRTYLNQFDIFNLTFVEHGQLADVVVIPDEKDFASPKDMRTRGRVMRWSAFLEAISSAREEQLEQRRSRKRSTSRKSSSRKGGSTSRSGKSNNSRKGSSSRLRKSSVDKHTSSRKGSSSSRSNHDAL